QGEADQHDLHPFTMSHDCYSRNRPTATSTIRSENAKGWIRQVQVAMASSCRALMRPPKCCRITAAARPRLETSVGLSPRAAVAVNAPRLPWRGDSAGGYDVGMDVNPYESPREVTEPSRARAPGSLLGAALVGIGVMVIAQATICALIFCLAIAVS